MSTGIVDGQAPSNVLVIANLNGLESPYFNLKVLNTADEAREWTRRILALGADAVMCQTGRAKDEVVCTTFEEGHRPGKPAFIRSTGPEILPRKAADLGADAIPLNRCFRRSCQRLDAAAGTRTRCAFIAC